MRYKNLFIFLLFFNVFFVPVAKSQFAVTSDAKVEDLLKGYKEQPKAETYYLIALSHSNKGNYHDALKVIRAGLQIDSNNTRLLNLLGAIYSRQGRLYDSMRIFNRVLTIDPSNSYAHTSLKTVEGLLQPAKETIFMKSQRSLEKTTQTKKDTAPSKKDPITELKPDEPKESTYFEHTKKMQQCYYQMETIKRAQDSLTSSNPEKAKQFSLSQLAAEDMLHSEPICPDGGVYQWDSSDVSCSVHGKRLEAGAEIEKIYTDFNKALRAKFARNYLGALKNFEQIIILHPNWGEAHYQMADTLFRLGESDAAQQALRTALKLSPENIDAKLLLANIYYKKEQNEAALKILDEIANNFEGSVYALSARSVASSIRSGRNYYQIFPPN